VFFVKKKKWGTVCDTEHFSTSEKPTIPAGLSENNEIEQHIGQ